MFELPEYIVLSRQVNQTLTGKMVHTGNFGNSPHKFVWHNLSEDEFARCISGKLVGESFVRGRWLFVPMLSGYTLLFGECGGRLIYHPQGSPLPAKYHLHVTFDDGSFMSATTQMWGAMELHQGDAAWERQYIKDMRPTPLDDEFTFAYFTELIDEVCAEKKTSAKALLTQDQIIPGLGNAITQDILFTAHIHPRQEMSILGETERRALFETILSTIDDIIRLGGRYDEVDLFGQPGGYVRLMDKNAAANPCPSCGTIVEKFAYLGGACYFCPGCQEISN
jgi:formamidopyrimidine-DNA glycosylase